MNKRQTGLISLLIFLLTVNACKKDPTSSNDDAIKDIDGNVYTSVIIGEQEWMVENLKVARYRNGEEIPTGYANSEWESLSTGAYAVYDNELSNVDTYGNLYNGYAVDDIRNIAPSGWHVPTDDEWKELELYLGMGESEANQYGYRGTDEGGKLKETGNIHWSSPNTGATNESGYTAMPGGYRYPSGDDRFSGSTGIFWSTTSEDSWMGEVVWYRQLNYDDSFIARYASSRSWGYSIRCVRD